MLYSLLVAVILLAAGYPLVGYFCFVKGYNLGAKEVHKPQIKTPILPRRPPKESAEVVRLNKIMENINNYDGTGIGQEEVRW